MNPLNVNDVCPLLQRIFGLPEIPVLSMKIELCSHSRCVEITTVQHAKRLDADAADQLTEVLKVYKLEAM